MLVKLFANLRLPGVGDRLQIPVEPGHTVRNVLEALFDHAPALRELIMAPEGDALQPHVNVMLQGRLIRDLQGLHTPVTDDATLGIFPPVAGG